MRFSVGPILYHIIYHTVLLWRCDTYAENKIFRSYKSFSLRKICSGATAEYPVAIVQDSRVKVSKETVVLRRWG